LPVRAQPKARIAAEKFGRRRQDQPTAPFEPAEPLAGGIGAVEIEAARGNGDRLRAQRRDVGLLRRRGGDHAADRKTRAKNSCLR